ncbi:MAG: hypothetical protein AAFY59_03910, partial [Pseudomonadota bacterium]
MSDRLADLEVRRAQLECDKLAAEIAEKRLAWWKRPAYLGGAAPVVIALAGVLSAWAAGFFDTQRANLERDLAALEASVADLGQEEARLRTMLADNQLRIDTAYLKTKNALEHAQYTAQLIGTAYEAAARPFGTPFEDFRAALARDAVSLPPAAAQALEFMIAEADIARDVAGIEREAQEDLSALIEALPASDWAKLLTYDPIAEGKGALKTPDGEYY